MRANINYKCLLRRMSVFLLAMVVMFFNSGCSKHLSGRPKRIRLVENEEPNKFEKELIELEAEYDKSLTDTQTRRNIRDQYSRKMMAVIDKRYNDFLDDLVIQRKGFDASADIMAVSLDAASVLFTPVTTKSILAGLSALTTAGKTSINKVYFYEQTLPVLIAQMESNRQSVLADLIEGLSADDITYPLYHAQRDLNRYFAAGTIDGALAEIQKQAAKKADDAQVRMRIRKEVESELESARTRHTTVLAYITDQASFDKVRTKTIEVWHTLNNNKKVEHADTITEWATARGVSINEPLLTAESGNLEVHSDRLVKLLESLEYNKNNRLFLADVASTIGVKTLE